MSTDLSTTGVPAAEAARPAIVRVALERRLREPLDYLPMADREALSLPAGARVRVPFGRRHAIGVVIGHAAQSTLAESRLRRVSELLDTEPLLDGALLEFWSAGRVLPPSFGRGRRLGLPRLLRGGASAAAEEQYALLTPAGLSAAGTGEPRRAPRQRALLELLAAASGQAPAPRGSMSLSQAGEVPPAPCIGAAGSSWPSAPSRAFRRSPGQSPRALSHR